MEYYRSLWKYERDVVPPRLQFLDAERSDFGMNAVDELLYLPCEHRRAASGPRYLEANMIERSGFFLKRASVDAAS